MLIAGLFAGCQTRLAGTLAPSSVASPTIQDAVPSPTKAAVYSAAAVPSQSFLDEATDAPDAPAKVLNGFNLYWVTNVAVLIQASTNLIAPRLSVGSVTLAWTSSTDTNVVGYNVYFGGASEAYTNKVSAGAGDALVISNLVTGATYYFAATAYDNTGMESPFSNEASCAVPPAAATQWSGLTNVIGSGCFIPCEQFWGLPQVFFRAVSLQQVTLQIQPVYN